MMTDDDDYDNDTEELRDKKAVQVEGSRAERCSRLMFGGVSSKCLIGSASVCPSPLLPSPPPPPLPPSRPVGVKGGVLMDLCEDLNRGWGLEGGLV